MPDTPTSYTFERFPRRERIQTAAATEATEALAKQINARLSALIPVSTTTPDTVNKILARQNSIVDNINALAGQ